jgi:peptidoglycan L-alanyl-D-glutamate endopeptidase CwlK
MKDIITALPGKKLLLIPFLIIVLCFTQTKVNQGVNYSGQDTLIIDSRMTLDEALEGVSIPPALKNDLDIVNVYYYSFDNKLHSGQIVIRKKLSKDIIDIFKEIQAAHFPINKAVPIVKYNWSDIASMEDNNTSAFNYRMVKSTRLISSHAKGTAIDINPLLNPQIKHGRVLPPGIVYDPSKPGTLTAGCVVVRAFIKRGWQWGGYWQTTKDYQHFEKILK